MAEERVQRRLAAILAADVVGYSRLIEQDEASTLATLKERRRGILAPLVAEHHGRIVKVMGDGVLVEFASAVNAVACAAELQKRMVAANDGVAKDRQVMLRIGINLGDVVVEGGDLYGDGVIIAARLQAMAEPGGICIAGSVHDQVANKLPLAFNDLGSSDVKNIASPVPVFRVRADHQKEVGRTAERRPEQTKPAIAVLPFTNMSGDPEQEYFSDGITEDIITDLSRVSALFVAARNTAFRFKGKAVEIVQAARELNVGYILEGSVRKVANRVRITVQLIDGATGGHVWAERYDRDLGDIFAMQDEIARSVVAALKVKLLPKELASIADRSTSNADAYEYYLQGRAQFAESWGSRATMTAARKLDCGPCPPNSKCCANVPERKVPRDVHEEARDHACALMGTPEFEKSRDERKRVEMRFAHPKAHYRFERMRLRGLTGARDEFHLAATVQNLKALANHSWCPPPNEPRAGVA
jgi:adenylate cyclase